MSTVCYYGPSKSSPPIYPWVLVNPKADTHTYAHTCARAQTALALCDSTAAGFCCRWGYYVLTPPVRREVTTFTRSERETEREKLEVSSLLCESPIVFAFTSHLIHKHTRTHTELIMSVKITGWLFR